MILSGNEDSPCDKQGEFDELSINKIKKSENFLMYVEKATFGLPSIAWEVKFLDLLLLKQA